MENLHGKFPRTFNIEGHVREYIKQNSMSRYVMRIKMFCLVKPDRLILLHYAVTPSGSILNVLIAKLSYGEKAYRPHFDTKFFNLFSSLEKYDSALRSYLDELQERTEDKLECLID
jgi:hypothetical protein